MQTNHSQAADAFIHQLIAEGFLVPAVDPASIVARLTEAFETPEARDPHVQNAGLRAAEACAGESGTEEQAQDAAEAAMDEALEEVREFGSGSTGDPIQDAWYATQESMQ